MVLTSTDFTYGNPMPGSTARSASNRSPALAWSLAPGGTKSFALVCVDLSPVANGWVHWLVVDVPAAATSIASGASGASMPAGARELRNTYGSRGWGGPEPPSGTGRHEYEFTVYALDAYALGVPDGADLDAVTAAMEGHVLDSATLVGTFER